MIPKAEVIFRMDETLKKVKSTCSRVPGARVTSNGRPRGILVALAVMQSGHGSLSLGGQMGKFLRSFLLPMMREEALSVCAMRW